MNEDKWKDNIDFKLDRLIDSVNEMKVAAAADRATRKVQDENMERRVAALEANNKTVLRYIFGIIASIVTSFATAAAAFFWNHIFRQ